MTFCRQEQAINLPLATVLTDLKLSQKTTKHLITFLLKLIHEVKIEQHEVQG